MTEWLFALRALLAAVLAAAGVAKLRERAAFAAYLARQALPWPAAAARAVPAAELLLAGALLAGWSARAGLGLAAAMLALFAVVLERAARRGDDAPCACFGSLVQLPGGRRAVWRALALLAVAVALALADRAPLGLEAPRWTMAGPLALVGLLSAVALLTREVAALRTRVAVLEREAHAADAGTTPTPGLLRPGVAAPPFLALDLDDRPVTLASLLAPGRRLVLVFAEARCGPCRQLLPHLREWESRHPELVIAVLASGTRQELRGWQAAYGLQRLLRPASEVREEYGVPGTPAALVIGPTGLVERSVTAGVAAIATLVREVVAGANGAPAPAAAANGRARAGPSAPGAAAANGSSGGVAAAPRATAAASDAAPLAILPVGEALPPLELRDLAGVASPICGPDGRGALVVFWSEDCLSCDELLDRLRTARFGERPASPALVLVTAGELAAPPLPRSPWPILRDPDFSASARLGIPGTPAALLLDRDCAPLAPPAIGAAAVAALAGLA